MPAYLRYYSSVDQTLFLTLVTAGRSPWLASESAKTQVLDALRATKALHRFHHHGHVLLDDHLHLLISVEVGKNIPRIVSSFKQASLARLVPLPEISGERVWQRRYYDHIIRDEVDFYRHLDYLHYNPVKHGLVSLARDWKWSSLSAWQARGAYPSDWGQTEPDSIRHMTE